MTVAAPSPVAGASSAKPAIAAKDEPSNGLSGDEARRLEKFGPNAMPEACQLNRLQSEADQAAQDLGCGRLIPDSESFAAEAAEGGSADQVGLLVEGVVDCCVGGEEALG